MELCSTWSIKLANAFHERQPTWRPAGTGSPKVLDYIGYPCRADCKDIAVQWMQLPGCSSSNYSDHALVSASIGIGPRQRRKKPES
eukprot:4223744-Pyramimonas_sp.AAC.1